MSIAGQEVKIPRLASFYGRSFPRATILLDESNQVKEDRKDPPPSVVAPLLGKRPIDMEQLPSVILKLWSSYLVVGY